MKDAVPVAPVVCEPTKVTRPELRPHFWKTVWSVGRQNPAALEFMIILISFYLHMGTFAKVIIRDLDRQIVDAQLETPPEPQLVAA